MSTVVVWVLILRAYGGPTVVDNIATERNCLALLREATALRTSGQPDMTGKCIAVRKANPPTPVEVKP